MTKVMTYGTFDLLHKGHISILKRAKALGTYLIVGVTGEEYDKNRGKLNVAQSLHQRIKNIEETKLADEIIVEESEGQKVNDVKKHEVDILVFGSDWTGKYDYLKEYCQVVYLPRTKGVSSTELRNEFGLVKLGIIGTGTIAQRFIAESRFVNNVDVVSVFGSTFEKTKAFAKKYDIKFGREDFNDFLNDIDAVYIATPHNTHYDYTKKCLKNNKHVLCEKPMVIKSQKEKDLLDIAEKKNLILLEAIKTAFCSGFSKLVSLAKSGIVGDIIQLEANFTKLISNKTHRAYSKKESGGAHNELMSYLLLAACKILGENVIQYQNIRVFNKTEVDIYSKLTLRYEKAIADLCVGIGAKKEGDLIISGTKGYIYCPSPWWLTKELELRFECSTKNEKFTFKFEGDGLRYEIAEFANCINNKKQSIYLYNKDMIFISKFINLPKKNIIKINL